MIVLIDAANSSATFQFAQNIRTHHIRTHHIRTHHIRTHHIRTHHLGTLIGQPTGGSQRGINGGASFFLRLPHSGIEMDLPLIGTFPPVAAPDAGVTPDIAVQTTAADIAAGNDAVLAAAMRAVR